MKKKLIASFIVLLYSGFALAQSSPQMYAVYRDQVKPSLNSVYRENLKKLKAACEQHKTDFHWTTIAFDDNAYSHMIPIKSFADLDKNMLADLEAKMGKEALNGIFADVDKCIETSTSFVVTSVPAFSYLAPTENDLYRDALFWYPLPGKEAEAEKLMEEWLKLYRGKNVPSGIYVVKFVFGSEPGYVIFGWGKNAADVSAKDQKSNELFGEEAAKLWDKTLLITRKYHSVTGWVLKDYSNPPAPTVASSK